ncbi:glycerol-3-phosphate acyltransferase 2, mitochondrial isoform X1 [Paramormyrops kingsleyae]|uniref:glycerol-3-phosphate acyltransferase 2, mitochondrial isoform X1 n=1 Tax=Paramormyrops kingsleyae TaxID=1676925 RepID=UPI000CD65CC2|nr:glycerol-3-phosphate acyltransferase 2, mitochondrial-like isoform X3 [Paramormyrops kingsleyae]XP_023694162.1 glycerol-3-phosphate acyltransferase 2, mitochondrial-like isoform X3 [Paramormyrops kingsleyae]XP_023694163.1 glycerol-3-phosphate acyltransferase 2, mitochondrial-like isoform X3 [Paramormyrops kingsleyae]
MLLEEGGGPPGPARRQPPKPRLPFLWRLKMRKKLKTIPSVLGIFRPVVGRCCHQCTPKSLGWKLLQPSPSLGFRDLLSVNETHTRYRGWLVRRLCGLAFVWGCRVYPGVTTDIGGQVRSSERVQKVLSSADSVFEVPDQQQQCPMLNTRGQASHFYSHVEVSISPVLLRVASWMVLKLLRFLFCNIQINLNQVAALQRATDMGAPLVFVFQQQCALDYVLIPHILFCHNLRVPYTVCHLQPGRSWLRLVLQRLGVVCPPPRPEGDAEASRLCEAIMTSFISLLLREGQSVSLALRGAHQQGPEELVRLQEALRDGSVPDVTLVPVAIAYDLPPQHSLRGQQSPWSLCWSLASLLWDGRRGSVRIHFAQPFSLKEMCESRKCHVDGGRPLQELLLPSILGKSSESLSGCTSVSSMSPTSRCPESPPSERELSIALDLHLLHATSTCTAIMSTTLVSCLLLHKHREGVRLSQLCRDVLWLVEEVVFRNQDVGFGGSLPEVVFHAVSLLQPHLHLVRLPHTTDPLLAPRSTRTAILALAGHCPLLTHVFIMEAVGACAVLATLREVAACGGGGEVEFDVVLSQEELSERALQLCHLLPAAGYFPPCQSPYAFALDAVDSLVHCGVLVLEEQPQGQRMYDYWKREKVLIWSSAEDGDLSDSDCERQDTRCYKLGQPSQGPELFFFLCSLLSVQLRALSWAVEGLEFLQSPLPEPDCVAWLQSFLCDRASWGWRRYESTSADVVRAVVRTVIDLGVLERLEEQGRARAALGLSPLFQQPENRRKLHRFIEQFVYK